MVRKMVIAAVVLSFVVTGIAIAAPLKSKMEVKMGDEIYVCNCPESCTCDTMSRNPGKCTCGVDMVKLKVKKVEKDKIYFDGRTKGYLSVGKYACNCGPKCPCNTISQNPGKCTCGVEMKSVN